MFTVHMESLALVGLLAALLVILHVAVAAYLYRVALSGDARPADGDPTADDRPTPPEDRRFDDADARTPCPTCGTPNDPSYRFCRRCVADLSGQRATADGVAAGRLGS